MQLKHSSVPSLFKILAAWLYEGLIVIGISLSSGFIFVAAFLMLGITPNHSLTLFFIFFICGIYFTVSWSKSGQTLALKSWGIKLVRKDGSQITLLFSVIRFVVSIVSISLIIGLIWIIFDRERCFLHDRLVGTRLINLDSD